MEESLGCESRLCRLGRKGEGEWIGSGCFGWAAAVEREERWEMGREVKEEGLGRFGEKEEGAEVNQGK